MDELVTEVAEVRNGTAEGGAAEAQKLKKDGQDRGFGPGSGHG
jgi:hypothetical protein